MTTVSDKRLAEMLAENGPITMAAHHGDVIVAALTELQTHRAAASGVEPVAWHTTDIRGRIAETTDYPSVAAAWAEQGYTVKPLYALSPITDSFQQRVAAAHVPLFHDDPTDLAERRDRFGEEANELQQALGQTRENAHMLVDYTYDRPVGAPEKEIGAAALTLASLCVVGDWNMMECAEADLRALQTPEKISKVRAKRANRHGRGPLPGLSPISAQAGVTVTDEMVERMAGYIASELFRSSWEGLGSVGRVTDQGFKPIIFSEHGGMKLQGHQDDLRDLARSSLTAALLGAS